MEYEPVSYTHLDVYKRQVHRMAIRGRQRICDILLTPKPVAAVLRLAVNAVARNAIRAFLFHQWDVIPSGSILRRYGWRYLVRFGISAVDAVIFIYQRLMPMLPVSYTHLQICQEYAAEEYG